MVIIFINSIPLLKITDIEKKYQRVFVIKSPLMEITKRSRLNMGHHAKNGMRDRT